MTDELQVIEIPLETTFGMIKGMSIPDKDMVEAFAHSALRAVRMALVEDNIYSAIDTLDKTRLVEEYIKSKVHRNQAQLQTQNIIAADRYEMLWELGGWLDENIKTGRANQYNNREVIALDALTKNKPVFWLSDLGIDNRQSSQWQRIRTNISDVNDLRSWCQDYIADGKELQWGLLWSYANPRPPREPEPKIEVDLTPAGKKFYQMIKNVRKSMKEYFEYLSKNDVPLREYIFMGAALLDIGRELLFCGKKLNDRTE
jgi:hypothetical protein